MDFKRFLMEYGTKVSATGSNAGGRAGQSMATPEMGAKKAIGPVPASPLSPRGAMAQTAPTPPSSFNVSSKGKVNPNRPPSPLSPRGMEFELSPDNKASPLSPRGWGDPAQFNANATPQPEKNKGLTL